MPAHGFLREGGQTRTATPLPGMAEADARGQKVRCLLPFDIMIISTAGAHPPPTVGYMPRPGCCLIACLNTILLIGYREDFIHINFLKVFPTQWVTSRFSELTAHIACTAPSALTHGLAWGMFGAVVLLTFNSSSKET